LVAGDQAKAKSTWEDGFKANKFNPWGKKCQEMLELVAKGEERRENSAACPAVAGSYRDHRGSSDCHCMANQQTLAASVAEAADHARDFPGIGALPIADSYSSCPDAREVRLPHARSSPAVERRRGGFRMPAPSCS